MPTKKRRVGFIPRSDVLDLINKLSFESNLSISKIINILVEEALYKRGIFNIKNGNFFNYKENMNIQIEKPIKLKKTFEKDISKELVNFKNAENQHLEEPSHEFIDQEIYEKFLMFLQFQDEMKKRN